MCSLNSTVSQLKIGTVIFIYIKFIMKNDLFHKISINNLQYL